MATQEDRLFIIDSLRPIFPQLQVRMIEESIDAVRQTVGEIRELIIPGCIDYLLERNIENNQARNNQNNDLPILIEDEVSMRPAGNLERQKIRLDFNRNCELGFVTRSIYENDKEIYVIDDTPQFENNFSDDCFIISSTNNDSFANNNVYTNVQTTNNVHAKNQTNESSEKTLDPLTSAFQRVLSLFPDIQHKFLEDLIRTFQYLPLDTIVSNTCDILLEKGYSKEAPNIVNKPKEEEQEPKEIDYYKDYKNAYIASSKCADQCIIILENEFPRISARYISKVASYYCFHYAASRKHLEEKLLEAYDKVAQEQISTVKISPGKYPNLIDSPIRLLKRKRNSTNYIHGNLDPNLQKEVDFVKKRKASQSEEKDRQLAFVLNEKEYEAEGQMIECGCCYVETTFEDMVQCLDGHLFCVNCLKNYAKEAVFGQGKALLSCMTSDCDSTFPMAQLKRSLDQNILSKYEDRLAEESLCLAGMDDLVRCPHCDFAAVMEPDDKVFKCQNTKCLKETCRYCKEEWKEHFGLKCSEVEKNDEKNMRLSYEEKMTMAKIRKCHKCGCEFTKSDGCNKMTCRCGTTMCYICRKPSISYNHFCQHPKDPGRSCNKCTSCSLWSDPSEDDDMAVKQIEQEAKEAKRKLAPNSPDAPTLSKRHKASHQDYGSQTEILEYDSL